MATNMDADDPSEYCHRLWRIDFEQVLIKEKIVELKRELRAINTKAELFETEVVYIKEYVVPTEDIEMQTESRDDSDDFAIADLVEISKDTKQNLPTVVNTGRLLSKALVGNDVAKNNDPIENQILKFDLLLKIIIRDIQLFEEISGSNPRGSNDTYPSAVCLEGVNEDAENTDPNSEDVIEDDDMELTEVEMLTLSVSRNETHEEVFSSEVEELELLSREVHSSKFQK